MHCDAHEAARDGADHPKAALETRNQDVASDIRDNEAIRIHDKFPQLKNNFLVAVRVHKPVRPGEWTSPEPLTKLIKEITIHNFLKRLHSSFGRRQSPTEFFLSSDEVLFLPLVPTGHHHLRPGINSEFGAISDYQLCEYPGVLLSRCQTQREEKDPPKIDIISRDEPASNTTVQWIVHSRDWSPSPSPAVNNCLNIEAIP
jgi:hypothetical protein